MRDEQAKQVAKMLVANPKLDLNTIINQGGFDYMDDGGKALALEYVKQLQLENQLQEYKLKNIKSQIYARSLRNSSSNTNILDKDSFIKAEVKRLLDLQKKGNVPAQLSLLDLQEKAEKAYNNYIASLSGNNIQSNGKYTKEQ